MAPTTLPPAERPRVTPPCPHFQSCRTRNPHNVAAANALQKHPPDSCSISSSSSSESCSTCSFFAAAPAALRWLRGRALCVTCSTPRSEVQLVVARN